MTTANERILDASVRHMVWLERFKASEVRKIIALLNKADAGLQKTLLDRLHKIEERGVDLGPETTKRIRDMGASIAKMRATLYDGLSDVSAEGMVDFAEYEAEFQAVLIEKSAIGAAVIEMNRPATSQLRAIVRAQPFQGRLLKEWYSSLAQTDARRINDAVRIGIAEGQTTDQIVRRIRGTRAARYRDGVLEISRRDVDSIVRTAIAHVADRSGQYVWEANADIIKGLKWVSTLDSRTSATCRERDGRVYPVKSAPPIPAHFRCRSRKVPYMGETSIKGSRASAFGPVPDDWTYEQWLKRQPLSVQQEVLGVKKAKLFRDGGLPLDRFADDTGREYTLAELKRRDANIWNKTFSE
ncbi:minor capsid protein [Micavibrio aeruginosavorus]|uniref:Phage head morphogenesis, SPP1 gp7 family domain protein n=1 Tax=Micavibrio aeruginosavorus (strain ARL-13) TaxID=856793 RepID=G2KMW6_MICAA|nr:minor capsid protein [Micavibrio aeruginosavorus]AEP08898.1 phage head morphogenesis, SPP1 gp7 family domain protein [Micavibrio aeruginosavorus ARL-13]